MIFLGLRLFSNSPAMWPWNMIHKLLMCGFHLDDWTVTELNATEIRISRFDTVAIHSPELWSFVAKILRHILDRWRVLFDIK